MLFIKAISKPLRAAVDDPASVPNGRMPDTIGNCLVYAIYHSPLPFIRTLLEIGADPNPPVDNGFLPLIAALTCAQDVQGSARRTDVHDMLRLLLTFGADPNQRGINDCTPLHIAVAARDRFAIQLLLDAGAEPELPTRIDDCATPLQMAHAADLPDVEATLAQRPTAAPSSAVWVSSTCRYTPEMENQFAASTLTASAFVCG